MRTRDRHKWLVLAAMAAAAAMIGCGKEKESSKYINVAGRVTSIDFETGEVSIKTYSHKDREDRIFPGRLAMDAEIFIDGKTARLEDVQVDDFVTARIRVIKRDGERHRFVTKIEVKREGPAATDPATGPASGNPSPTE